MPETPRKPSSARPRKRGIYLLPNLFTTGTLFGGFYAIIAASQGRFIAASIAIFIAMLTDMLDGRVARLTHAESDFGIQYDSLGDLVAFGLATGLLAYQYSLITLAQHDMFGKIGWLAAFFYAAATALRLARFNIARGGIVEKKFFLGLPCPAAAGLLVGFVWASADYGLSGQAMVIPVLLLTIAAGALMVSGIRYNSFKNINIGGRVPFRYILFIVLGFILIVLDPPRVLFIGFLIYAVSGPFMALRRRRLRRKRPF
jgi:CDP-diacylglycerol--serine O-phosphatidyltransferase